MKRQHLGILLIFVIGINAESAQPWWLPLLLILLLCLLIIVSAYRASFRPGAPF